MSDRTDAPEDAIPDQMDATQGRTPPNDIEAEQCVLGSMLLSPDAIAAVIPDLDADDFYRPAHQKMFTAITEMYAAGDPVDPVTFHAWLAGSGLTSQVGGGAYVHTLIANVPTAVNATYYAQIVRDRAVMRRLVAAGTRVTQMGYGSERSGDVDDLLARAQKELDTVAGRRAGEDYVKLEDVLDATMDEIDAISQSGGRAVGVPSGLADLDYLTSGFHPQQLIVIAGRPGLGKSTLGMDVLREACVHKKLPGAIFSLEMSRSEIVMRLLSAEGRVPLANLRTGRMEDRDWDRLARTMGSIADAPLFIDDSPNLSMTEIRAKARRLKQQHDIRIIVVDYLQLMSAGTKVENRQQEVASMSRALKLLAKDLDIPVIAISQLNRGPEQRHDKRPQLSDLRESGAIEQDADVVILVHRDDYYEKECPRAYIADLLVAKHRNGPTRDIEVSAQLHISRFGNRTRDE
jgi:replicative DNA helicase